MADRLGVTVTTCDSAPYIGATLAALAAQSRPPDEVVVHDAASVDDTLAIVKRWESMLPLRIVASSTRTSAGESRNRAMRALTTELVTIVDHDDFFAPDHLETLQNHHGGPNVVVSSRALLWTPGESLRPLEEAWRLKDPSEDRQLEALFAQNWIYGAVLADRQRLLDIGGYRDDSLVEDWDLWIRLALAGVRFVRPAHATTMYRWGHGNTSGTRTADIRAAAERMRNSHREAVRLAIGDGATRKADALATDRFAWTDTHAALTVGDWPRARSLARSHLRTRDRRIFAVAVAPRFVVRRFLDLPGRPEPIAPRP